MAQPLSLHSLSGAFHPAVLQRLILLISYSEELVPIPATKNLSFHAQTVIMNWRTSFHSSRKTLQIANLLTEILQKRHLWPK
jgi:hypothetical protein